MSLLRKPFPVKLLLPNVEAILVYHIMEDILEIFNITCSFVKKKFSFLYRLTHTNRQTRFKVSRLLILSILLLAVHCSFRIEANIS